MAFLNVMSLYTDRTNPYTEIIGLILLGVGLVISTVSIWKTMGVREVKITKGFRL